MTRLTFGDTPLSGLYTVRRMPIEDRRGSFTRLFCAEEFAEVGWRRPIAQINQAFSKRRATIRGLHYQLPPHAEAKLVTCLRGRIWDVAVDVRSGSPTFLRWYATELSARNLVALYLPEGFAHGYQTLCDDCEVLYLHSTAYAPAAEAGLNPTDPRLAISWPLPAGELSEKDANRPRIDAAFSGVSL